LWTLKEKPGSQTRAIPHSIVLSPTNLEFAVQYGIPFESTGAGIGKSAWEAVEVLEDTLCSAAGWTELCLIRFEYKKLPALSAKHRQPRKIQAFFIVHSLSENRSIMARSLRQAQEVE
jgi:hypothetical protein